jgi:hypothetical protein
MATVRNHSHTAARVISGVGALFAVIEVVYILLILFGANAGNAFYKFVQSIAIPLALFFPGLFNITNEKLAVVINYGLAAVFWLVVTGFVARIVD